MKSCRIVVDAMGGDNAPEEIVKGTLRALEETENMECVLVGDEKLIQKVLFETQAQFKQVEIVHTGDSIAMNEDPKNAVESKPEASINVAAKLVSENEGDALVSAGNTGATILACSRTINRLPGIERAALAAIFPAMKNKPDDPGRTIMLDVGATLHCTTNQLISFAIMGMHYAHYVMNIESPRVGLLNIGEEETKGHDVQVEAHQMLRKIPEINFIGNLEGKDVLRGNADVIVSEGFVGNIVLKALEGVGEIAFEIGKKIWKRNLFSKAGLALLSPVLNKIKKRLDYTEYGGAPILGLEKLVIKSHGRSNAKALKNALLLAKLSVENELNKHMEESIQHFYDLLLHRVNS